MHSNTPHFSSEPGTENYVIGVDYGTLSGRALVVRVRDGKELGSGVYDYPHAVVSDVLPGDVAADVADGPAARLPGEWALQVPNDYRDVLRYAVPAAIADAGIDPALVVGIATDFTACTMVPVKSDGTPLNELDGFANRPHAYVKLWRHHAAQPQADRINDLAAQRGEDWLPR
jgi:L-ribulokinase